MKDRDFLKWLHDRLIEVHKENGSHDYMHKLRAIISRTPWNRETPNTCSDGTPFYLRENI